jgi:putative colanic acid biosysnthesis UDP-glucose lipid carrier transferase
MANKNPIFFKWLTILSDYLLLNLVLSILIVLDNQDASFWPPSDQTRLNLLLLNFTWFYSSATMGLYSNILKKNAIRTIKSNIYALFIYLAATFLIAWAIPHFSLSTEFLIKIFFIFSLLVLTSRLAFLSIRRSRRRFWIDYKNVVIVGTGLVGRKLFNYFKSHPQSGYVVAGFFDDSPSIAIKEKKLILGKVEDCNEYARNNGISEIFCTLSGNDMEKINLLMKKADHSMVRFRLVPDLKSFFDKNVRMELYDQLPVLSLRREPLENKSNELLKRAFDLGFSLFVIVFLLSWLVPILAFIIKMDSKGPVLFKQRRSGKDNKPFTCYKFRSMHLNGESDCKQATKGDYRVTRVGKLLRKTSMDELPQFFNVLKGDMSIVGPRPHMIKHTKDYSLLIDSYMVRQFLTPGITGWAQVNGFRGETKETVAMLKRVEADLWYMENWSLMLDLKIIFLTIWVVVWGSDKAY